MSHNDRHVQPSKLKGNVTAVGIDLLQLSRDTILRFVDNANETHDNIAGPALRCFSIFVRISKNSRKGCRSNLSSETMKGRNKSQRHG